MGHDPMLDDSFTEVGTTDSESDPAKATERPPKKGTGAAATKKDAREQAGGGNGKRSPSGKEAEGEGGKEKWWSSPTPGPSLEVGCVRDAKVRNPDLLKQYQAVTARIVHKIKSWADALDWYMHQRDAPDRTFVAKVVAHLPQPPTAHVAGWMLYCRVNDVQRTTAFFGCIQLIPKFNRLFRHTQVADWVDADHEDIPQTTSYDEVLAASWNKSAHTYLGNTERVRASEADGHNALMHALNGNTEPGEVAAEMEARNNPPAEKKANVVAPAQTTVVLSGHGSDVGLDLETTPESMAALDKYASVQQTMMGWGGAQQASLTDAYTDWVSRPIQSGPASSDVPRSGSLLGMTVSSGNVQTSDSGVQVPEVMLFPRNKLTSSANPTVLATRSNIPFFAVGALRRKNTVEIKLTEEFIAIRASMNTSTAAVRDNSIRRGRRFTDLIALSELPLTDGDDPTALFLKGILHCMNMSWWNSDPNQLPLGGGHLGKMLTGTRISSPIQPLTVHLNDAYPTPQFNESLDSGVHKTLPFTGDPVGAPWQADVIYFHNTTATMPRESISQTVAAPAGLFNMGDPTGRGGAIAALASLFTPYPLYFSWVGATVEGIVGPTAATVLPYMPLSNMNYIPGVRQLHMLLPVYLANPPAIAYNAASDQLLFLVRAGPTAVGALAAGQILQVNAVGQPLVGYPMGDYFHSWFYPAVGSITPQLMATVLDFVAATLKKPDCLDYAYDLATRLSVGYLPLEAHATTILNRPSTIPQDTPAATMLGDFSAIRRTDVVIPVGNTWPTTPPRSFDMLIPDISPILWTVICTGIAEPAQPEGTMSTRISMMGEPFLPVYTQLYARKFAAACNHLYRIIGAPLSMYQNLYVQTPLRLLQVLLRSLFWMNKSAAKQVLGSNSPSDSCVPSECTYIKLLTSIGGFKPSMWRGHSIFNLQYPPVTGLLPIIASDNATLITTSPPMLLSDVFMAVVARIKPMQTSLFPPPTTRLMGRISGKESVQKIPGVNSYIVAMDRSQWKATIASNECPQLQDNYVWNARLARTQFGALLVYYTGAGVPAAGRVADAEIVTCRAAPPDYTFSANPLDGSVYAQVAFPYAMVDITGNTQYAMVSGAQAQTWLQVQSGKAYTAVNTWLLGVLNSPSPFDIDVPTADLFPPGWSFCSNPSPQVNS